LHVLYGDGAPRPTIPERLLHRAYEVCNARDIDAALAIST
jgi:hypothetical protein